MALTVNRSPAVADLEVYVLLRHSFSLNHLGVLIQQQYLSPL